MESGSFYEMNALKVSSGVSLTINIPSVFLLCKYGNFRGVTTLPWLKSKYCNIPAMLLSYENYYWVDWSAERPKNSSNELILYLHFVEHLIVNIHIKKKTSIIELNYKLISKKNNVQTNSIGKILKRSNRCKASTHKEKQETSLLWVYTYSQKLDWEKKNQ